MSYRASSIEHPASSILLVLCLLLLAGGSGICFGHMEFTPLEFLKDQEIRHKGDKGEVYLGMVMTLTYPASSVEPGEEYHPLLLELTDVLKTPLRKSYRIALKGYSDGNKGSGPRLENLKQALVRTYGLEESRISAEIVPSQEPQDQSSYGSVEVHIYGDVSEAIRFMEKGE